MLVLMPHEKSNFNNYYEVMTRQRFLAKQQCVENVIVVDALDVTRNRAVSLDCACSAEIVYSDPISDVHWLVRRNNCMGSAVRGC